MKTLFHLAVMILFMTFTAQAQIDIKGKIKNASLNRANQKTDEAIDKGLDEAEEGVTKAVKKDNDTEKSEDAEAEDKDDSHPMLTQKIMIMPRKRMLKKMPIQSLNPIQNMILYQAIK